MRHHDQGNDTALIRYKNVKKLYNMHNGLFFLRSLKNKDSVMNLWQSLKNTWNNFAFDNPEFNERIDEIRKRRKQREEELEEIEKQGPFNYYLKDVGGYIREAMNQYERENKK